LPDLSFVFFIIR